MAVRWVRSAVVMLGALMFLTTPCAIYSCGPFLTSEIFAFEDRPGDAADFAAGTLGIVRPGFRRAYLVVAYRYLTGLKLTEAQQKAAIAVWNREGAPEHLGEQEAVAAWTKARNAVPDVGTASEISPYAPVSAEQPYFQYVNCGSEAFLTATQTLGDRSVKFGAKSESLREWVGGQDLVFGNCAGMGKFVPAAIEKGDALLRADRAYQIAAAHFYARDFDAAGQGFEAIAKDGASPWSKYGEYLAARALIRKANLVHGQNESFDRPTMMEAQKKLEAIVADPRANGMHAAAVQLLNYVLFRTEPQKRVAELDAEMGKADPGANFKQDLWDYTLLLSNGEQAGDLSNWVVTVAALRNPNVQPYVLGQPVVPDPTAHALERWRATKSLPWLIAAMAASAPNAKDAPELLAAAKAVPASAAGYLSARYYALRLMAGVGQAEQARKELDALLTRKDIDLGSHNLLNDERQTITTSLKVFLAHAAELPVPSELDFNTGDAVPSEDEEKKPKDLLFNRYPAEVFLKRMPLAMTAEAARSTELPANLRREVARSAWVRAVLVSDAGVATQMDEALKELDKPLWTSMEGYRSATNAEEKRFAGIFVILNNPGMKPSVRESSLRSATLGEIDNYRDNWWCASMDGGPNWGQARGGYDEKTRMEADAKFPFPEWVNEKEREAAQQEWKKLGEVGTAPNYLALETLGYAKKHPGDARVPQALHLVVRATRYGCTNEETSRLSKAAFEFLHEHYPQSEWAGRTKYYY
jgi:hypothetical protein